jgi:hypothetical protein
MNNDSPVAAVSYRIDKVSITYVRGASARCGYRSESSVALALNK